MAKARSTTSKVASLLFGRQPAPSAAELTADEVILQEGSAALTRGMFGGRWGPLILTNRRLIWYESRFIWPLKRQYRIVNLDDILSVDKGSLVDAVGGGSRLRIKLRNGKTILFFEGGGELDSWVERLSQIRSH